MHIQAGGGPTEGRTRSGRRLSESAAGPTAMSTLTAVLYFGSYSEHIQLLRTCAMSKLFRHFDSYFSLREHDGRVVEMKTRDKSFICHRKTTATDHFVLMGLSSFVGICFQTIFVSGL